MRLQVKVMVGTTARERRKAIFTALELHEGALSSSRHVMAETDAEASLCCGRGVGRRPNT